MTKKKIRGIIVAVVVTAGVGTGAAFGVRHFLQNRSSAVEVVSVADQNAAEWINWSDNEGTSGTVVSDVNQQVRIPESKVIDQVYVSEGDSVKIGDKLISYDTTLLELDKELQELTVQEIQLEIKSAESDLKKLQNTTPVAKKDSDDSDTGSILDDMNLDDGDEDLARMSGNDDEVLMAAAQEDDAAQAASDALAEPQSGEDSGENAVQPQESASGGEGENHTAQTDAAQTDAAQTDAAADDTATDNPDDGQSSAGDGSELIVGGDKNTQVLTPDDLGDQNAQNGSSDQKEEEQDEEKDKKPKMNQSTKGMLTRIRMKTMPEEGDNLLADTKQEDQKYALDGVTSGRVRIIPHFSETAGRHFEKQNTYMMLIKGLDVKEDITGKIYGIARIDGNDYPEIGGYTLVKEPTTEGENVARLTMAFHDGLEEQHEKNAELEDVYLEIVTETEKLDPEKLVFCITGSQEDDVVIRTGEEKTEPDTSDTDTSGTSDTDFVESELVPQPEYQEEIDGGEQQENTDGDDSAGNGSGEDQTEENQTEEDQTEENQTKNVSQVTLKVNWQDGTNSPLTYPKEMAVSFYNGQELVKTIWLGGDAEPEQPGIEPGQDSPAPSDEPETEQETEASEEIGTETPESTENTEQTEGKTQMIENPDGHMRVWTKTVDWAEDFSNLREYRIEVELDGKTPIELYYTLQSIGWSETVTDNGMAALNIIMGYNEPVESPLVKLEPISELTYANGTNTENGVGPRAYKGTGTKEDPYVFFVTDGVVIKSSFVNWVLGFNEEGTERRTDEQGSGCYVRLEIREADTITGAFIRSIDLDGTIRVEYGYGPGTYWIFRSDSGITRYEEEVDDEPEIPDGFDPGDGGWGNDIDGETYTAEELAQAIEEKNREIRKLKLDERSAQLKLKQYEKDLDESTVVSAVNGYVKSVGGNEDAGEPYMVVSSQGGLYLKTTVSELDLDSVKTGDVVQATSWETGSSFTASITEINYFPTSTSNEDYFYGGGNSNASTYPVLAHIEDAEGLSAYEYVSVKFQAAVSSVEIYIPKAYIRSENGQSYVYKRDGNGRLKKQYVHTAGVLSGYVGIKEGLSTEDYIAFPYGKNVKDGAKTVEETMEFF